MGYMGSYSNIPKAIFYLRKGEYILYIMYGPCEFSMEDPKGNPASLARYLYRKDTS